MKIKKILKVPLNVLETVVENKTGLDLDLSEIFFHRAENGNASDVALAVSMPDGLSVEILWDPAGPVSSSEMIAVVESILTDRPFATSIQVLTPPTSSPQLALPFEPAIAPISKPPVTISYSEIDDATE